MIHGIFNKRGYGKEYFMKKHNTSNEEIKEILKILKKCEFGACITEHNSRVLLDYITNLQEENELSLRRSYEAYEIKEEYKLRIDKAIEYIEKEYDENIVICDQYDMAITPQDLYDDLINILKGEDNE